MGTIGKGHFTLKRIFEDNWEQFLLKHRSEVGFPPAYNVWKVMNRREPEGLGYAAYACPDRPDRIHGHAIGREVSILIQTRLPMWAIRKSSMPNRRPSHASSVRGMSLAKIHHINPLPHLDVCWN